MLTVSGPDAITTCGTIGRILEIGTSYVVGMGGLCSPIREWTQLSEYSSEELELLRRLRDDDASCATTEVPTDDVPTEVLTDDAIGVAPAVGILVLMLINAFL